MRPVGRLAVTRHPIINRTLHKETVDSLAPLLGAADRAANWDGIKTLSGPEAQKYLADMERLMAALPAAIEQLRKRINVSVRQGQHSLEMKRKKREEREAAARAAAPKAETADAPMEQEEDKLEREARKAEGEDAQ